MKTLLRALALWASAATAPHGMAASALPFVSPMFSSNMVLQRGGPVRIWGWAAPGSRISVSAAEKSKKALVRRAPPATAGPDGRWFAVLPALPVGGPYTVTASGAGRAVFENVLSGDVWLCSGQSNMEMGIANLPNANAIIAAAADPWLRLYTVQRSRALVPQPTAQGQWLSSTPENIKKGQWGGFSAVAYSFGAALRRTLKVPIGLVHSSWGGTPAEAWASEGASRNVPDMQGPLSLLAEAKTVEAQPGPSFAERLAAWYAANDPGSEPGAEWWRAAWPPATPTMNAPGNWERQGLPGWDGTVWYGRLVDVGATDAGKPAVLNLGRIDDYDTAWINGVQVGATQAPSPMRQYRVPAGVLKERGNSVVVRVLDVGGKGGFSGPAENMFLRSASGGVVSLAGEWQYRKGASMASARSILPAPDSVRLPGVLFNGMIAPLAPYNIRGVIWYQGESNVPRAYQYRTLLPALIRDWRALWRTNFPFLVVQLAGFGVRRPKPEDSRWAELREAQALTALNVPKTGIATAVDVGDERNIHPTNKRTVGERLALAALKVGYGRNVEASGPTLATARIEGRKVRLTFKHADEGLIVRGGTLKNFAIAGADRRFVWANATVDGSSVVVSSPEVDAPLAVRYGWQNTPECTVYNAAGLPAIPFRTDRWKGLTGGPDANVIVAAGGIVYTAPREAPCRPATPRSDIQKRPVRAKAR